MTWVGSRPWAPSRYPAFAAVRVSCRSADARNGSYGWIAGVRLPCKMQHRTARGEKVAQRIAGWLSVCCLFGVVPAVLLLRGRDEVILTRVAVVLGVALARLNTRRIPRRAVPSTPLIEIASMTALGAGLLVFFMTFLGDDQTAHRRLLVAISALIAGAAMAISHLAAARDREHRAGKASSGGSA